MNCQLLLFVISIGCVFGLKIESQLRDIQNKLNALPLKDYFGFGNANTVFSDILLNFRHNAFKNYTGEEPIFVYPMQVIGSGGWGNSAGTYFQAIACAHEFGLHFIGIRSAPLPTEDPFDVFMNEMPTIIVNPHPIPRDEALKSFRCVDTFPWQAADAWYRQREYVQNTLRTALDASFKKIYPPGNDTIPINLFHNEYNVPMDHHEDKGLPVIPDAAITLRCNEIIHVDEDGYPYGFVHFHVYDKLLPQKLDTLYILTEPESYNSGNHAHLCKGLLVHLREYISSVRPDTIVVVLRGHQFLALTVLANAKTAISCPTTFAFWPLIANNKGAAYMHKGTWLLPTINMSSNFQWITSPNLIHLGDLVDPLKAIVHRLSSSDAVEVEVMASTSN